MARSTRRQLATALLAAGLVLGGCTPNLSLPSGLQLTCQTDSDCPNSLKCDAVQRCVPAADANEPAPGVVSAVATPAAGKAGTLFSLAIESSEALVEAPQVTLALSTPVTLPCTLKDATHAACTYTATGHENGGNGGLVPYDVSLVNTLGVPGTVAGAGAINIELTPPEIATSSITISPVSPPPNGTLTAAGFGATINITVTASEPLASPPVITASPGFDSGGSGAPGTITLQQVGNSLTYRMNPAHVVDLTDPTGAVVLTVAMTDAAGNQATGLPLGTIQLDPQPLTISGTSINYGADGATPPADNGFPAGFPPRFSAVPGYNVVQVSFQTSKPVNPANVTVSITGGRILTTPPGVTPSNPATSFTYVYTVPPNAVAQNMVTSLSDIPQENEDLGITVVDDTGNVTTNNSTIVFDLQAPRLTSSTLSYQPDPAVTPVPVVTAAGPGTTVNVAFQATEPLLSDPTISDGGLGLLNFAVVSGNADNPAYDFAATMPLTFATVPDGTYFPSVSVTDEVGNQATYSVGSSLVVKTVPPPAPTTDGVTFTQAPWGDAASPSTPVYQLAGLPNFSLSPANDVSGIVLAYDEDGALLGQTTANPDGSFGLQPPNASYPNSPPFNLTATASPYVSLAVADDAGNISAPTQVATVNWIGAFAASAAANPNILTELPDFSPVAVQGAARSIQPSVPQLDALAFEGGTPIVTTAAGAWTQRAVAATAPPARAQGGYVFDTRRGAGVLFGGTNGANPRNDTWEWNGDSWTEASPATAPAARSDFALAYDPFHGVTVLFGGFSTTNLNDTWTWDGTAWTNVTPASGSPSARQGAAMTYDSSLGEIILFGGRGPSTTDQDTWAWNGSSWKQLTASARTPPARSMATVTYVPTRNRVVLVGGRASNNVDLSDVWEWDGTNWNSSPGSGTFPAIPAIRESAAAAFVPGSGQGTVVVAGGWNGTAALGDAWSWNGSTWNAFSLSGGPTARLGAGAAWDTVRGELDIVGGTDGIGDYDADNYGWSNSAWTNETPAPSPAALTGAAAAYDPINKQTVVFGGLDASGTAHSDTWLWNGHQWTLATPGAITARSFAAMAYAPGTGIVLFGGFDGSGNALSDTWVWNGTSWAPQGGTAAAQRGEAAMVWDSAGPALVLFGGYDPSSGALSDTWTWDGTNWSPQAVSGPSARALASAAFDPNTGSVLVFGGCTQPLIAGGCTEGTALNETWRWNGSTWANLTPSAPVNSPTARAGTVAAFDPDLDRVLVFGGQDGSNNALSDVWEWDEGTWSLHNSGPTVPGGRLLSGGAFDTTRTVLVIFGGTGATHTTLGDTWELSDPSTLLPAELLSFDFGAATGTVSSWELVADIGGTGATTQAGGTGATENGATVLVWNALQGAWVTTGGNATVTGAAGAPSAIGGVTGYVSNTTLGFTATNSEDVLGADGVFRFAVVPTTSQGNGNPSAPGAAGVGYAELSVTYTVP